MISVYLSGNELHDYCLSSLYEGCPFEKQLKPIDDYAPSDVAVIFGVFKKDIPVSWPRGRVLEGQAAAGRTTVVIDSGYVKRGSNADSYFMVGLNGLNGRADFKNHDVPGDRWRALNVPLAPWRKDGKHIVVCGQVPWDASVQNVDILAWCAQSIDTIRSLTDREIIYRPHPLAVEVSPAIPGARFSTAQLADDLQDAWAVVTYNSNTAVDAVIAGLPVFAADVGSMVYAIANHDHVTINDPEMPDRTQWAHGLAYAQWTPTEMAAGIPWRHLFG